LKLWKYINVLKPSDEDVVYDVGCGMGRILCAFARRPVRKCVGIEISTEYAERARQNAKRLKGSKAPIEIIIADAAEADYSEGTIYCLFNPFGTKTLEVVLERIHQSVKQCPRRIRIAYFNAAFENVLESCDWLRCYKRQKSRLAMRWGKTSFWTNENQTFNVKH
jgi:precorrin-6B methylase 2